MFICCFSYDILANEKDNKNCPSQFTSLKLVNNNNNNDSNVHYLNLKKRTDPFETYSPKVKLKLIKCALRNEIGVDLKAEMRKSKSLEEFSEMQIPINFSGDELVGQYDVMLDWILQQVSHQNENIKLRILRVIYKIIFKETPNVDTMYPDFPSPIVKQHFDAILSFLLQYHKTGSLAAKAVFFRLEQSQQKTERQKVEDRIKTIIQLFGLKDF